MKDWGTISRQLTQIDNIFFNYDPARLLQADPKHLAQSIKAIKCGNLQIRLQMDSLKANIETLLQIDADYGTIDTFVVSRSAFEIATVFSEADSPYKLRRIGLPLALEYLRNVGISTAKPDRHILRVLSHERLRFFDRNPTMKEACDFIDDLALESGQISTYVDNLLWMFCAKSYGNICSASPKCNRCGFRTTCSYPTM
jgi:hypothetical protein